MDGDIIKEEFRPDAYGRPNPHSPHSFRLTILDVCRSLNAIFDLKASDMAEESSWEGTVVHFDSWDTTFLLI